MNTETLSTTKWGVDPTHSEVQFKVKHLVISTVTGSFNTFSGSVESDNDNFEGAKVNFELDVDSIDTNVADRDAHLKSDDFFSAEKFPQITFTGTYSNGTLTGDLTIRDITNQVSLDVDFGGVAVDPYGQTKAGFDVEGKINRKDFGLTWSAVTEAGGVVVGDDVKLLMSVQFVKQ